MKSAALVLQLAILAACTGASWGAMENGTWACIQAFLPINNGVCRSTSLTSCPSACRDALDELEAQPGVTQDCYDAMAGLMAVGLEALGSEVDINL